MSGRAHDWMNIRPEWSPGDFGFISTDTARICAAIPHLWTHCHALHVRLFNGQLVVVRPKRARAA